MAGTLSRTEQQGLVLRLCPAVEMDDEQFFAFCRQNSELRIERSAEGDLIVMPPAGWETGSRNAIITHLLTAWALRDGTGVASDSSTGFILPNGATRSPDAAWVPLARLRALTPQQKERFLPLCHDFVVELRLPSDSLPPLQAKLEEYLANGTRLGWLLDAPNRRAYVYRPGAEVEQLDHPPTLSGEPELPGFVLDLALVWEPRF